MDQTGKVANPARGQLNREDNIPLSPCVPENLVSRDGFSLPVPRQPAHLHTKAESDCVQTYKVCGGSWRLVVLCTFVRGPSALHEIGYRLRARAPASTQCL